MHARVALRRERSAAFCQQWSECTVVVALNPEPCWRALLPVAVLNSFQKCESTCYHICLCVHTIARSHAFCSGHTPHAVHSISVHQHPVTLGLQSPFRRTRHQCYRCIASPQHTRLRHTPCTEPIQTRLRAHAVGKAHAGCAPFAPSHLVPTWCAHACHTSSQRQAA